MFRRMIIIGALSVAMLAFGLTFTPASSAAPSLTASYSQSGKISDNSEPPLQKAKSVIVKFSQVETYKVTSGTTKPPRASGNNCGLYATGTRWAGKTAITAIAICLEESGGNVLIWHCDTTGQDGYYPHVSCSGQYDRGLWQIASTHASISNSCAFNGRCNARQAYDLYRKEGFLPWTTYTSGAYLSRWSQAKADYYQGLRQHARISTWWRKFRGRMIVREAKHLGIGHPYVWGGTGPGYDCSGLVYMTFRHFGVMSIPRTAADQQQWVITVRRSQLIPGDLVFYGSPAFHVGIYVGHGKVFQALDPAQGIGTWPINYSGAPASYGYVHYHWKPRKV